MPSLYVQDTWSLGNRVTLNLGVRTKRNDSSFRTDVKETAFEFGFGQKIAPRLGATYDVLGDGRLKAFGSWGRYYDGSNTSSPADLSAATHGSSTIDRSTRLTSTA